MAPYACTVHSCGQTVNFYSDLPLGDLFLFGGYGEYIPELLITTDGPIGDYAVHYWDSENEEFSYEETVARITFPWSTLQSGEALLYMAYPLIERQHQEAHSCTLHSACVSIDERGVFFLGESGAGKTSMVLDLCLHHGARLLGNDLCVLRRDGTQLHCDGGTKFFLLRQESIRRTHPHLLEHFPESRSDGWSNKVPVEPQRLGVSVQSQPVELGGIYQLHIDNEQSKLYVESRSGRTILLSLWESLSRYARNTPTVFLTGDNYQISGYVPSLDSKEFFESRKETIRVMLEEYGVTYLSGSVTSVSEYILEQLHACET